MLRVYLKTLALPPAINLLLILLSFLLARRFPRFSLLMLLVALVSLYALSTPWVAAQLRARLETVPALELHDLQPAPAQAIVVLGAGRRFGAPEYGYQDSVTNISLQRLRYAAHLARMTGLPLLVSGGSGFDGSPGSEAALMAAILEDEFRVPVRWIEHGSNNTWENAQRSGDLLLAQDIQHVLLVTSAWHMPRAAALFRARGFKVVPAPTGYFSRIYNDPVYDWLPNATALNVSNWTLHELLGIGWYRLLGRI